MALVLKTSRKEIWIDRCEDRNKKKSAKNPVIARYKVMPITPTEVHQIFRDCEEEFFYEVPNKRKEMVRDTRTNSIQFTKERAKKCILGWEGLTTTGEDGVEVEIPYSKEMVETLYDLNPDEVNWVLEKIDEISSVIDKKEDGELVN